MSLFNVPLLQGLHHIFLNESLGLLWTAPLWFAWPIALTILLISQGLQRKGETIALGLMVLATLALFIPYAGWNASVHGNRYLFPAVTLGFVIIARAMHLWFATSVQNLPDRALHGQTLS